MRTSWAIMRVAVYDGSRSPSAPVVVFLHGLMGTPEEFAPFAKSLGVDARFIFPEGPVEVERLGLKGRAWWSKIAGPANPRGSRDLSHEIPEGLALARSQLDEVLGDLQSELHGRPLVIGGFSQGAMLACDLALMTSRAIAGLFLLSGAPIALREWRPRYCSRPGLRTLIAHGRLDADLSFDAAASFQAELGAAGWDVTWLPFDGGHEVPLVVWRGFKRWLRG